MDEGDDDDDDDGPANNDGRLRIVVCMTREGCIRLSKAGYVQSDISFKRVAEAREFELAGMDRETNTSM